MPSVDGAEKPISATNRRQVKARHGAGRSEVEMTESASADGTSFVTASFFARDGAESLDEGLLPVC